MDERWRFEGRETRRKIKRSCVFGGQFLVAQSLNNPPSYTLHYVFREEKYSL
jgi:hypothetical protein